ncbi:MAG: lipopolysaccharide biosynthesis protein RfbH [Actinomycetota bacterium]|nr:lipopolysaccharide biosynthesis protein RfbH [Actinomycetota bacterium]
MSATRTYGPDVRQPRDGEALASCGTGPRDDGATRSCGAAPSPESSRSLRKQILELVPRYVAAAEAERAGFVPGRTPVHVAGRVYDDAEVRSLVDASLEFWLTEGRNAATLESRLAAMLGVGSCRLVNSGSSANLLAFAALTSPRLGDRRIRPGDEVVTVAAAFPTTVAPIVQHNAVPVFVDVDPATANVDVSALEEAIGPRTRAVVLAHTLGNPFDVDAVLALCRRHDLWLVEDNCDALGSRYASLLERESRFTGTFGHLATSSFYPAHHMTTGEGGAVYTSDPELDTVVASLRDWGRDCYCRSGRDNTCSRRFGHKLGELPCGYDHKYTYSHFGYNLKMTDLQAAVGVAQLEKLPQFGEARRANASYLRAALEPVADVLELPVATPRSDPSWFGFLLRVRDDAPFTREALVSFLEAGRVQTRALFAGNILRHPCFDESRASGEGFRVVGDLRVTDGLMERAFWVGCHPGLTTPELDYVAGRMLSFCRRS